MTKTVRTRFAPSPTGYPHVGNIRTALFAWLFARHHRGIFIVRIEDTDVVRRVEGAVEAILDGLRWLGLDWDEGPEVGGKYGPYFQSQRLELYREASDRLIDRGDAYHCYCSPERLEEMRAEQARRKKPPGYDRHCRDLSSEERAQKEAVSRPPSAFSRPDSPSPRLASACPGGHRPDRELPFAGVHDPPGDGDRQPQHLPGGLQPRQRADGYSDAYRCPLRRASPAGRDRVRPGA